MAGGPIGKIIDEDIIEIIVDRNNLSGSINLVGHGEEIFDSTWGTNEILKRPNPNDLAPHPQLPDDSGCGLHFNQLAEERGEAVFMT